MLLHEWYVSERDERKLELGAPLDPEKARGLCKQLVLPLFSPRVAPGTLCTVLALQCRVVVLLARKSPPRMSVLLARGAFPLAAAPRYNTNRSPFLNNQRATQGSSARFPHPQMRPFDLRISLRHRWRIQ